MPKLKCWKKVADKYPHEYGAGKHGMWVNDEKGIEVTVNRAGTWWVGIEFYDESIPFYSQNASSMKQALNFAQKYMKDNDRC